MKQNVVPTHSHTSTRMFASTLEHTKTLIYFSGETSNEESRAKQKKEKKNVFVFKQFYNSNNNNVPWYLIN